MCLYKKKFTISVDLKGAPAVDINFHVQIFSLYKIYKSGIAAASEPTPSE